MKPELWILTLNIQPDPFSYLTRAQAVKMLLTASLMALISQFWYDQLGKISPLAEVSELARAAAAQLRGFGGHGLG